MRSYPISIRPDVEKHEFLNRMIAIAKRSEDIRCQRITNIAGYEGWESINLEPRSPSVHKKLGGSIIADPEAGPNLRVEVMAKRWAPDPPTYDVYVEAARTIFLPLIKAYNEEHKSRCRLNIRPKMPQSISLPAKTQQMLNSFVICANKNSLHPNDWNRFYHFISFCHAYHVNLDASRLRSILSRDGFRHDQAEFLSDIYLHGRNLLASR